MDELMLKIQGPITAMEHIGLSLDQVGEPELTERNAKIIIELLFDEVFIGDLKDLYGEVTTEKKLKDSKYLMEEFPFVSYASITLACNVFTDYIRICEQIGRPHRYVNTHERV